MSKAAITGDYTDLRFVKGRKVAQIVVEIPIEGAEAFVKAFGTPLPDRTVPVALARLLPQSDLKEKLQESIEHEKHKRTWNEMSSAQQAGIACNEQGFWKFLNEQYPSTPPCAGPDDAAEAVHSICGVTSRSRIDFYHTSRLAWRSLYSSYRAWLQAPEQAA